MTLSPFFQRGFADDSTVPAMSMPALVGYLRMIRPAPLYESASLKLIVEYLVRITTSPASSWSSFSSTKRLVTTLSCSNVR